MSDMIRIEKIVPGGQALGMREDGKKVFLWGALPGEVVEWEMTREKAHYAEGIATKVAEKSVQRVEPRDECWLATSPWQMMNYKYELEMKRELVRESLAEQGIMVEVPEVVSDGREYFYRNKMEYSLYYDKELERIQLAMHVRGTHRKLPIRQSSLERKEIWERAQAVVAELNARGEEARKYQALLLRCNQAGEVEGGLLEKGKAHPNFKNLTDVVMGRKYNYSPNGFFQINLPVYEMALKEMQKWVQTAEVLDLYAGVGTIGLTVARGRRLTLVECNGAAYRELERNVKGAGGDFAGGFSREGFGGGEARAVLAKAEEALDYVATGQMVIVDPPRAGCDKKLVERLLEVRPRCVIYLSCNPATQARDAKMLLEKYKIVAVKTFNFFPRTPHIENLIVLEVY